MSILLMVNFVFRFLDDMRYGRQVHSVSGCSEATEMTLPVWQKPTTAE
jgi:hypothetical protein